MCVIRDPKGPLLYSFNFSSFGDFTKVPYKIRGTLRPFSGKICLKFLEDAWQYVKYGNVEDLYKKHFCFRGSDFLISRGRSLSG